MSRKQIDQLIICSPYREPDKHWRQDEASQEFEQVSGRRQAGYTAASKAGRSAFIPLEVANAIRARLKEWKDKGRPGLTGVSKELLEYWESPQKPGYPFFFCQLVSNYINKIYYLFLCNGRASYKNRN